MCQMVTVTGALAVRTCYEREFRYCTVNGLHNAGRRDMEAISTLLSP